MRTTLFSILLFCVTVVMAQEANLPESAIDQKHTEVASAKKVEIKVMDMRTRSIVPHFTVDFTSCGHPVYRSSQEGVFTMEAKQGFACYVRIGKTGYANLDLLIDYESIDGGSKTYNVFLSRSPNYFTGSLRDSLAQHLYLDNAYIELVSSEDGQIQRARSNEQGAFSLYLEPETKYTITIQRKDYRPYQRSLVTGEKVDDAVLDHLYLTPLITKLRPEKLGTEVKVLRKTKDLAASKYFSVQVLSRQSGTIDLASISRKLDKYGEVYLEEESTVRKVKVGKFFDRRTAEQALTRIRREKGFEDAFLTQHLPESQPLIKTEKSEPEPGVYMVRLASYLDAKLFDGNKVAHLGPIRAYAKGEWTIMLLDGFDTQEKAQSAMRGAHESGFQSAYVVLWEMGKLKRVR